MNDKLEQQQMALMTVTLTKRPVRDVHEVFEATREFARYLFPYPPTGRHHLAWWRLICDQAGVECDVEDLTLARALELYAYLLGQAEQIFEEINTLAEKTIRKV